MTTMSDNDKGAAVGAYDHAVGYWDRQPADVDGVLGGFGHVSDADLRDSELVLTSALKAPLEAAARGERHLVAVDCGAGVGRVTGGLLLRHFATVDLLEPSRHLLDTAVRELSARCGGGNGNDGGGEGGEGGSGRASEFPEGHAVGRVICAGLQDFDPPAEDGRRYDCVWVQWCMLYLTDGEKKQKMKEERKMWPRRFTHDPLSPEKRKQKQKPTDDVVRLMDRCLRALKPDGILFIKENICKNGAVPDEEDASVTRSDELMRRLFERAGAAAGAPGGGGGRAGGGGKKAAKWRLVHNVKQRDFPKNLFEVRMYVLRPIVGDEE